MTMSDSYITQGVSSGQITKFYKKQAESYQDNFDSNKALNFIRLILKDNSKKNQIKDKLNKKLKRNL